MRKLNPADKEYLNSLLPSEELLGSAIAYELGKVGGITIFDNYPEHFNEVIKEIARNLRKWLVNPPNNSYVLK